MEDGDDRSRSDSVSSSQASTPLFASSRESTPDLLDEVGFSVLPRQAGFDATYVTVST